MDKKEETYITLKEAAKITGLTTRTIKSYAKRGILTAHKFPDNQYGRWYVRELDIPAFMRKNKNG